MQIPYGIHYIDKKDINNVSKLLKSKFITQGPLVEKFEKTICKYLGVKYAVAISSCTAGLHLAVKAIFKKKSKIITSPVSFVSTGNSILFNDLKPVFVDIDYGNLNIDLIELEKAIRKTKNIRAIMPVHLGGLAAGSKKLYNIAKKNKLFVIEDAAHSFGGKYEDGSMVGSCKYADMTVFSFHPVKTITTGEGGMVTTNSKKLYQKLLLLRNHGIQKEKKYFVNKKLAYTKNSVNPWYYEMVDLGYNYRINDIQCALGLSQFTKLKKFLVKRLKIAKFYDDKFKKIKEIKLFQSHVRDKSSNHLYVIGINFKKLGTDKNKLMNYLNKNGIISQLHYIPIPMHPYYRKLKYNMKKLVFSQKYYQEALSIPIHYKLSLTNLNKIVKLIKKFVNFTF